MTHASSEARDPPTAPAGPAAPPQPPVLRQSSRQQQATDPFSPPKDPFRPQAALRAPSPATPQVKRLMCLVINHTFHRATYWQEGPKS